MIRFVRFLLLAITILVLLGMISPAGFASPSSEALPTTDTVARGIGVLRLLENKYRETKTFFGEFNQLKVSELFLEEIRSKGRFWYEKPGRFRCEYLPPDAQVNLIVDDKAYV